jgi:ribosomal-protein-alanine N-acetyltransferase
VSPRFEPIVAADPLAGPLALLHRDCFPDDPWDASAIGEIMRLGGFFGWIAWTEEEPAGFVLARRLADECEILSLGVLAGRRRAGIGAALLDLACREAPSAVLEVAVDNLTARAFYAGREFRRVGRRRGYYRRGGQSVDALILRRGPPGAPVICGRG